MAQRCLKQCRTRDPVEFCYLPTIFKKEFALLVIKLTPLEWGKGVIVFKK